MTEENITVDMPNDDDIRQQRLQELRPYLLGSCRSAFPELKELRIGDVTVYLSVFWRQVSYVEKPVGRGMYQVALIVVVFLHGLLVGRFHMMPELRVCWLVASRLRVDSLAAQLRVTVHHNVQGAAIGHAHHHFHHRGGCSELPVQLAMSLIYRNHSSEWQVIVLLRCWLWIWWRE